MLGAALVALSACEVCPNGAAASNTPHQCARGDPAVMITGIDFLPFDQVKLTNKQMQQHFAFVDVTRGHALVVGEAACYSYVTVSEGSDPQENYAGITIHPEGDEEVRTGLTPFTQILDLYGGDKNHV